MDQNKYVFSFHVWSKATGHKDMKVMARGKTMEEAKARIERHYSEDKGYLITFKTYRVVE